MSVYVNLVAGEPDFGSLPAGKITRYPLEKRDYRPFAQAQFALSAGTLTVRLTAFEARPDPGSAMLLVLEGGEAHALTPDGGGASHAFHGEDLQGIYWGAQAAFDRAALEERLGRRLGAGGELLANVFKICPGGERRHFGCLFESAPVWDAEEARRARLGPLQIVAY